MSAELRERVLFGLRAVATHLHFHDASGKEKVPGVNRALKFLHRVFG